jgi:hypothetical protein
LGQIKQERGFKMLDLDEKTMKYMQERKNWVVYTPWTIAPKQIYRNNMTDGVIEEVSLIAGAIHPYSAIGVEFLVVERIVKKVEKNNCRWFLTEKVLAVKNSNDGEVYFTRRDDLVKYLPKEIIDVLNKKR